MSTLVASNLQAAGGAGTVATLASINGGPISGTRNRIINGGMAIDQRNAGASQSLSPGVKYTVDRWLVSATGATVTGQQVQGASAGQYRYRITGAAGVTEIVFAQRIESINSADLAGKTVTLSVDIANSALSTVTWYLQYPTSVTDNFSTITNIATGTWTVTSTVTRYSTQVSVPAAAVTGLQVALVVGAQTSGTWTIGDVQLEQGTVATPFERRSYGQELSLCQRYYEEVGTISTTNVFGIDGGSARSELISFTVDKRAVPTITLKSGGWSYWNGSSSVTLTATSYEVTAKNFVAQLSGTAPGITRAGAGFTAFLVSASIEL
jgi:hypothetical protein